MYGRALEIRQLASEGKTEEVILEVVKLNPDFFEQNPQLLFQLKQVYQIFPFDELLGSFISRTRYYDNCGCVLSYYCSALYVIFGGTATLIVRFLCLSRWWCLSLANKALIFSS
jgi:hypothetical protein